MPRLTQTQIEVTDFGLWGTQGGGLARWDAGKSTYVWHELPDWYADRSEIKEQIGDSIPEEWGLIPANSAAYREISHDESTLEG